MQQRRKSKIKKYFAQSYGGEVFHGFRMKTDVPIAFFVNNAQEHAFEKRRLFRFQTGGYLWTK
jgi:hypothetical protein